MTTVERLKKITAHVHTLTKELGTDCILCPECRQPMNILWSRSEITATCMETGNHHAPVVVSRDVDIFADWQRLREASKKERR